jgi:hypothetical protein
MRVPRADACLTRATRPTGHERGKAAARLNISWITANTRYWDVATRSLGRAVLLTHAARLAVKILAWAFLLGTLWALIGDLGWPPHRMSENQANAYILRAVVDGKSYTSWGLTYAGQAGHRLRLAEIAAVLIAMVLSLLPRDGLRRLGLAGLVAWAGLWLGNAMRAVMIAPIPAFLLAAVLILVCFVATASRAGLEWTRRAEAGVGSESPTPR